MEVYVLDSLLRRVAVVDKYESLIWTERFSAYGDFQLVIESTQATRTLFSIGVRISTNVSYRVMTVQTVEDSTDEEGRRLLTVKGPSLEEILEHRWATYPLDDYATAQKWTWAWPPKLILEGMFEAICISGETDPGDIIPGVTMGNVIFPADTIDAPSDEIILEVELKTLYLAIKELADAYGMGFRLVKHPATSALYFDAYMGRDRTTGQTVDAAVVFSPDLENLRDVSKLTTAALYKNVAYVVSPVGHEIVYDINVDSTVEGFERRAIFVYAEDIEDAIPADATEKMVARGRDELAKHRQFTLMDGQLAHTTNYVYGVDYNLGDLVELRDDDGTTSNMQVTEQIFVDDKEGERAYPTLSAHLFITPGSWLSMGPTLEWADMTDEEWADM